MTVKKKYGSYAKEGLLKENIDGEALNWAYNKMTKRKEEKDFDGNIRWRSRDDPHFQQTLVILKQFKKCGKMDRNQNKYWAACYRNSHDVTRYYSKALKIADIQDLGDAMINQLSDLFSEEKKISKQRLIKFGL